MSSSKFATPFRALLWKEWRESWWLLALAVLAPVGWYAFSQLFRAASSPLHHMELLVPAVSYVVALSLGARLFAGGRAQGTAAFDSERPVTRSEVWNAKLLMPALALLVGEALLALTVAWLWRLPDHWRNLPRFVPEALFLIFAPLVLTFASSVLCSVLLDRPVTAWAGGAVLGFVLWLGPLLLLQWIGVIEGRGGYQAHMALLLVTLLGVEPVGLLWLSRVAYVRWLRQ